MSWFNYYGLIIMAVIMTPNIIYAATHSGGEASKYRNKAAEIFEQIGRYGCLILMVFNIPYTYFGFCFEQALAVYLAVNGALCVAYVAFWIACRNRTDKLRALSLSIIPTVIFVFGGVMLAYIPLIAFAVLFGATHIFISCKNAD